MTILHVSDGSSMDSALKEDGLKEKDLTHLLSPRDFFSELIDEAVQATGRFNAHPLSKSYLSELLVNFLPAENLFLKEESGQSKMISEMWFESQNQDPGTRIIKLKRLADVSLYVSGFFASSFKRKIVNQSYYIQFGEMAFSALSKAVNEKEFEEVYEHFSTSFTCYVNVLTEVSHKVNIQKSGDILDLFERYIDSGSEWAEKQLVSEGVYTYPLKKTSN